MDIEQLKLILETLQGVGHEAGNLAVLYLWLKFATTLIGNLCIAGICVALFYCVLKGIRMSQNHYDDEAFICEMRDQLRTGSGGFLTPNERQRTLTALRNLVAKEKQA